MSRLESMVFPPFSSIPVVTHLIGRIDITITTRGRVYGELLSPRDPPLANCVDIVIERG
jgi:hypothetical protein